MTKLLNVVTGEYVSFISSMEYDKIHKTPINTKVIVFEDSHEYSYRQIIWNEDLNLEVGLEYSA